MGKIIQCNKCNNLLMKGGGAIFLSSGVIIGCKVCGNRIQIKKNMLLQSKDSKEAQRPKPPKDDDGRAVFDV